MRTSKTIKSYYRELWFLNKCGYPLSLNSLKLLKSITRIIRGGKEPKYLSRKFNELHYNWINKKKFLNKYYVHNKKGTYLDFEGALLPDITHEDRIWECFKDDYLNTFFFHCFLKDNYNEENVLKYNDFLLEGVYCYHNDKIDVTINKGDLVIDAGSWIGDFAAFAASKGAITYAFEPDTFNYKWLLQTADLNNKSVPNMIIPVQKGLGSKDDEMILYITQRSGANSINKDKLDRFNDKLIESNTIQITTIDNFVKENNFQKVDFIKADIEGAERYMLQGAKETLKKYAPKLAICTYHLPDDPQVLEAIIMDANPNYNIVHTSHKLFASIKK